MPKQLDVDKARRILPQNAVPGIAELNSNFSVYIAEVNPDTAGENAEPVDCGSVAEVAEKFKPKVEFSIKKLNKIGSDNPEEEVVSSTMEYGKQPKEIMNDFKAENVIVKSETTGGEKVLLDQQLSYLAIKDLEEKLRDQKFRALFESDKEGLAATLEAEIERVKGLQSQSDFDSAYNI